MSLFARLFGKKSKDTDTTEAENTNTKQSIGLSVVFKGSLNFDKDKLLDKLKYSGFFNNKCQIRNPCRRA